MVPLALALALAIASGTTLTACGGKPAMRTAAPEVGDERNQHAPSPCASEKCGPLIPQPNERE